MSHTPRPLGPPRGVDARPLALPSPPGFEPPRGRPAPPDEPGPAGARRPGGLSMGLVWRGVRRRWWQALAAWAIGSAGLVALADRQVRPTFEATSNIRVEPGDRGRFRDGGPGGDFEVFKRTQARRVSNPGVIAAALAAHPELLRLPALADAKDPESAVRKSIVARVVPDTDLIEVAMASSSADEPARVVDAVVEAFLQAAEEGGEEAAEEGRRLRAARDARAEAVEQKRAAIRALAGRLGAVDSSRARDRDAVALDQYKTLSKQLLQTELDLMAAQARLDRLRDGSAATGTATATDADPARAEAAVVAAFYADPQVAALRAQVDAARVDLARAERVARGAGDPARVAARKAVDAAQKQIDALWSRKEPGLTRAARASASREAEARQAAATAAELKALAARLGDRMGQLDARTRASGEDELTLEFARQDLARAEAVLDSVARGLDRHELEARGPAARLRREFPARPAEPVDAGRRARAMALAPLGMLLGVVGFLALAELRSGRVVGPDDLPARLRPHVLGVLPSLPRSRRPAARRGPGRRDDLDQFLQGLDHLRVVLCDRRDDRGRRSLLITSATGGEGKTTLAAQLAERCVNAGLSTLLVDADLRNPTLSRMFDRPDGRGLADVLRGEATAEEAIAVIGDAGGVHFLPAGTDRADPGRLLHGEKLGRLLARARESFALVIVDAPPVLPVPDALTIGRWVDGAVLAVRSDASRFPLVERADQRLAAMGVPVLGAVVNGVRDLGAAYGVAYGAYAAPGASVSTLDA